MEGTPLDRVDWSAVLGDLTSAPPRQALPLGALETIDWDAAASAALGITDPVGQIANVIWGWIDSIKKWFEETLNRVVGPVAGTLGNVWGFLKDNIPKIGEWIQEATKALQGIGAAFAGFSNAILQLPQLLWAAVPDWFRGALTGLADFFTRVVPEFFGRTLPAAFGALADFFGKTLPEFFARTLPGALSQAFGATADFFTKTLPAFFTQVLPDFFARTLPSVLTDFVSRVAGALAPVADFFARVLPGAVTGALGAVADFFARTVPAFFADVAARLSSALAPVADFFARTLPAAVAGAFGALADFFTKTIPAFFTQTLPAFFADLGARLAAAFSAIADFFTKTIPAFFTQTLPGALSAAFGAIADFFTKTLPGALSAAFGAIAEFFTKRLPAFFTVDLPGFFARIGESLAGAFGALARIPGAVAEFVARAREALTSAIEGIRQLPPAIVETIARALALPPEFREWLNRWLSLCARDPLGCIFRVTGALVRRFAETIKSAVETAWSHIVETAKWVWDRIMQAAGALAGVFLGALKGLWEGTSRAVAELVKALWEWAVRAVADIIKAAKAVLGLRDPAGNPDGQEDVLKVEPWWRAAPWVAPWAALAPSIEFVFLDGLMRTRGMAQQMWAIGADLLTIYWAATLLPIVLRNASKVLEGVTMRMEFAPEVNIPPGILKVFGAASRWQKEVRINFAELAHAITEGLGSFAHAFAIGTSFAVAQLFLANLQHLYIPRLMLFYEQYADKIIGEVARAHGIQSPIYSFFVRTPRPEELVEWARRWIAAVKAPRDREGLKAVVEGVPEQFRATKMEHVLDTLKLHLTYYGYPKWYSEFLAQDPDKFFVQFKDRFGADRKLSLSVLYELPTHSELARMTQRDIFPGVDVMKAVGWVRGWNEDLTTMIYLLTFRYPSFEKLWQFYMRALSGMLWFDAPPLAQDIFAREAKEVGAETPISPLRLQRNMKGPGQVRALETAINAYLKWLEYSNFSWFTRRTEMYGINVGQQILDALGGWVADSWLMWDVAADIPTKIDMRWMCVLPGTVILGDNKPIEKYKVGDRVLYGGKVLETFVRPFKGNLVVIKGLGLLPIKVTPEHPILVVESEIKWKYYRKNGRRMATHERVFSEPFFVEAEKVRLAPIRNAANGYKFRRSGHYLVVPRLKGEYDIREIDLSKYYKAYGRVPNHVKEKLEGQSLKLVLDEDTAWMFGFYVGDGSVFENEKGGRIRFYPAKEEHVARLARIIERYGGKPVIIKHENYYEVVWVNAAVKRFLAENFGGDVYSKRMPDFILLHKDEKILKAFLRGYLDADGNKSTAGDHKYEALTVSKILAQQLQLLCFRLGYVCTITLKNEPQARYSGEAYRLTIEFKRDEKRAKIRFTDDYVLVPVVEVSREPYDGFVYNLETEKNVYLVSNAIVHNCRYGIFQYMADRFRAQNVAFESYAPLVETIPHLIDRQPASQIQADLTWFSKLLQATGLHPAWVPVTTVAENIMVIADEMTLLRTGWINLFKEGLLTHDEMERALSGLFVVSYRVGYWDAREKVWMSGWINLPVRWLPHERRLLEYRALIDRIMDLYREYYGYLRSAVRTMVITPEEAAELLRGFVRELNAHYAKVAKEITGFDVSLKHDEEYIGLWTGMFAQLGRFEAMERARLWWQRVSGWLLYRVAQGYVDPRKIEEMLLKLRDLLKLADIEIKAYTEIVGSIFDIVQRERVPTPWQVATLAEYMEMPPELAAKSVETYGVPEEFRPLLLYIAVRPLKSDYRAVINAAVRAWRYGAIDRGALDAVLARALEFGFTEREVELVRARAELEHLIDEIRQQGRGRPLTPWQLAAIAEYVDVPADLAVKAIAEYGVPQDYAPLVARYIELRPVKADYRAVIGAALRAFRLGALAREQLDAIINAARAYGFTDREIAILRLRADLEELIAAAREYVPTPAQLAAMAEYVPAVKQYARQALEARRATGVWAEMWLRYVHARTLADDLREWARAALALVERLVADGRLLGAVLDSLRVIGYEDHELALLRQAVALRAARRAWEELLGSVGELSRMSRYAPAAADLAWGRLERVIDALPADRQTKDAVKAMWRQFLTHYQNYPEIRAYIGELVAAYAYGIIGDAELDAELQRLRELGVPEITLSLVRRRAQLRRLRAAARRR
jgi:intein/homing endonuclease/phage-related protein